MQKKYMCFDKEDALSHLTKVWDGYPDEPLFEIRIIPRGKGWPLFKFFRRAEEAVSWLDSIWEGQKLWERNVFYGVLPRYGKVKGAGRSENVRVGKVVFSDLDYHEELNLMEALLMGKVDEGSMKEGVYEKGEEKVVVEDGKVSILRKPPVTEVVEMSEKVVGRKPSLVVDSGHGYHIYYILERAVDVFKWSLVQARLVSSLKADERVKDPARLLRVAGTVNPRYRLFPARCKVVYESDEVLPV